MKSLTSILAAALAFACAAPDPAVAQPKPTTRASASSVRPTTTAKPRASRPSVYLSTPSPRISRNNPARLRRQAASGPRSDAARDAAFAQMQTAGRTAQRARAPGRTVTFRNGALTARPSGTQRRNRQRTRATGAARQANRVNAAQSQANQQARDRTTTARRERSASPVLARLQPVNSQEAAANLANTVLGRRQLTVPAGASAGAPGGAPPNPGSPGTATQGTSRPPSVELTRIQPADVVAAGQRRAADVINGRATTLVVRSGTNPQ